MAFISFAQNLEDVMLYRALGHVHRGTYVDVGAQDPVTYSVTKAFYDRGWRGVNIEPVAEYFDELERKRPLDSNLKVAVSDAASTLRLFEVPGTGLSTVDRSIAEQHTRAGYEIVEHEVAGRRLDEVCAELDLDTIHFLKIDAEGAERRVLEGLSLERYRPWIIVVEATQPMTEIPTHDEWEHLLLRGRYSCAYSDGLNRFYLADERADLGDAFHSPPGTADNFVRHSKRRLRFARRRLSHALGRLGARLAPKHPSA